MWDAHSAVVEAYADRPWYSRAAVAGSEARLIWDRLRADLRRGDRRGALARALPIARDPQLARGLWDVLFYRFLLRRRGGRYTRSGAPSVRVWATAPDVLAATRERGLVPEAAARPRGFREGLSEVLRRPAGVTVTDSALRAAAARLGGSAVVRADGGRSDALEQVAADRG
jgi:hypothetical protein